MRIIGWKILRALGADYSGPEDVIGFTWDDQRQEAGTAQRGDREIDVMKMAEALSRELGVPLQRISKESEEE